METDATNTLFTSVSLCLHQCSNVALNETEKSLFTSMLKYGINA